MTSMTPRPARRARLLPGLALALLALAGCEAQPVGTYEPARYVADPGGQAYHYVAFQPGSAAMAAGEQERLGMFLRGQTIGPRDDILLRLASGSQVLDTERVTTLRSAFAGTPGQLQVASISGAPRNGVRPNLAQVEVIRRNKIVVQCPGNPADPDWELTTPLPEIGCANAYNLATQAAEVRDLFQPRPFGGTDSTVAATAVQRLQQGKVKRTQLDMSTSTGN
jgi:type IV pilus biogenesis protein CpaD/CtpE